MLQAGMLALGNMCSTPVTQMQIGASGSIASCVRVVEHSEHARVASAASTALCAISWNDVGNRLRCARAGAVKALYERALRHMNMEQDLFCVERCCAALASLMLYRPNHIDLLCIGGLETFVKLMQVRCEYVITHLTNAYCLLD
jgi:hypothetical protein